MASPIPCVERGGAEGVVNPQPKKGGVGFETWVSLWPSASSGGQSLSPRNTPSPLDLCPGLEQESWGYTNSPKRIPQLWSDVASFS